MSSDCAIIDFGNDQIKRTVLDAVRGADGLHWFEMRRCKDQRTLNQNAFFHAVIVPHISKRVSELSGESVGLLQTKAELKDRFLRFARTDRDTGEIISSYTKDTHSLDVVEMCDFIDKCIQFAVEQLMLKPILFEARPLFKEAA